jgi:regulator of sirC expression with transglutaminase-like and TPR domain
LDDYRQEYLRRHGIDHKAMKLLYGMTTDLQEILHLVKDDDMVDGSLHIIGQTWYHPSWATLLAYRSEIMDVFKRQAQQQRQRRQSASVFDRLLGFLAARCLQTLHFAEGLYEWKLISEFEMSGGAMQDNNHNHMNSMLLERYALLVCQIQQSPPVLLSEQSEDQDDITQVIICQLEEIAEECRRRIQIQSSSDATTTTILEKILIVKDVLVHHYQFEGNEGDYYNYRNSLLHCMLESKKGIPITLCILYTCICRRLDLKVHLTGLPGHVVLGFYDDDDEGNTNAHFLDVFNQGQLLTLADCQRICSSYGVPWNPDFLIPLPAPHVLQRILNNLNNCYAQARANANSNAMEEFHSDMFFQRQLLASILRQPPGIAGPLVDRAVQELPLTLFPELLRYYGLLSRRSGEE